MEGNAPGGSEAGVTEAPLQCDDCGRRFKNAQGLAGHRRLAHSTSTRSELDAKEGELARREAAAKKRGAEADRRDEATQRREAEVLAREREIAEIGPAALGMVPCRECGSWEQSEKSLGIHRRTIHPIENAVAGELSLSPERVVSVWTEAARKQERHPRESAGEIVRRFWDSTDRAILGRLLARNATFRRSEDGGS